MPRISAPTVREHHARVAKAIVDAAEQILREEGPANLTAGAVSARAGVARNSIYRYVDSIDALRGKVLDRYMPAWLDEVDRALSGVTDPAERLSVWARVNLRQSSVAGHAWLMNMVSSAPLDVRSATSVEEIHRVLVAVVVDAWRVLSPDRVELGVEVTRALVNAGMRRLDAGDEAEGTIEGVVASLQAVITALQRQ